MRSITDDLSRGGIRYAVVGGLAVSVRSAPRFTRDIDLALAVQSDADAEACVAMLMRQGYELFGQLEHDSTNRLAAVRMLAPASNDNGNGQIVVDLRFASSGIENEIVQGAESIEFVPGLHLPAARIEHLIALKVLSMDDETRPQDRADVRALIQSADDAQLQLAAAAVQLIQERGFGRGKDLANDLRSLIEQPGS